VRHAHHEAGNELLREIHNTGGNTYRTPATLCEEDG